MSKSGRRGLPVVCPLMQPRTIQCSIQPLADSSPSVDFEKGGVVPLSGSIGTLEILLY